MEAQKGEYFVDGFMIRHFGVFPIGYDKDNLFEEQKVFLMYLVGNIPEMESWQRNVDFRNQMEEIKNATIDDVELSAAEISLAELHGTDLTERKKERLKSEKRIWESELRKSFGFRDEPKREEEEPIKDKKKEVEEANNHQMIWELLNGKRLKQDGV